MYTNNIDVITKVDFSYLMIDLARHREVKCLAKDVGVTSQCLGSIKLGKNTASYPVGVSLLSLWADLYLPRVVDDNGQRTNRIDWLVLMDEIVKHREVVELAKEFDVSNRCLNLIKTGVNTPSFTLGVRLVALWTDLYLPLKVKAGYVRPRRFEFDR